jgi:ATP-dependent DNA helicase RecG
MRVFSRLARDARAWMEAPADDRALASLEASARAASGEVPEARRSDWERLLAGFASAESPVKRRARVQGLVRACRLFDREARDRERRAQPLAWSDPVERADGIGPTSRAKLAAQGVRAVADLVWTLPVGWDDLREPVGIAAALGRALAADAGLEASPRQCLRGLVTSATLVPMRGGRSGSRARLGVRVVLADAEGAGAIDAWWFYTAHGVLALARPGTACLAVGRVRVRAGKRPMIIHPDLVRDETRARGVRPRYPALGVPAGVLRRAVADVVARTEPLPDPIPADIAAREGMLPVEPLLRAVHHGSRTLEESGPERERGSRTLEESGPERERGSRTLEESGGGCSELDAARRALAERLAWVEAFARVWQRLLSEGHWAGARAAVLGPAPEAVERFLSALGFALTGAQRRAVAAIAQDLASAVPMRRLLLGDVGTGKTAVALAAAAQCASAGHQCALLVPTGILAEQYLDAAAPLVAALGLRVERVVAGMRAADRRAALAGLASGDVQVVVGTHALLEEGVNFARLGLVVVDEQQRLGVAQRLALVRKGASGSRMLEESGPERARGSRMLEESGPERARGSRTLEESGPKRERGSRTLPHLLSLSATPIPRTLALALRGELATSVLDERPRGRGPVPTELCPVGRSHQWIAAIEQACARGERAFFVCPRIEDDEDDEGGAGETGPASSFEARGATTHAERLAAALAPVRVGVVHGAMSAAERSRAMAALRRGEVQVLVGTTVLEVGIDVPEATVMVVHEAERFGLAQLHQLRGRVGRGARPGRCVLVHGEPLLDLARTRLETLARTYDGADVARADLALRGAGDLGGTRQSGVAEGFLWLDPADPPPWVERIEADARALLTRDPELSEPEHRALALALRRAAAGMAVREEAG